MSIKKDVKSQPSPKAFLARSNLDPTLSGDVTEKDSPVPSQTSRGQWGKRERLGTRLDKSIFHEHGTKKIVVVLDIKAFWIFLFLKS